MRYFVFIVCVLASTGCIERQSINQTKPFEVVELESCLGIMIDMSGSFSNSWDDRAHKLFLQLMDKFFTAGMGANTRVVIGQISGREPVVLFEGKPNELRRKFQSPEDLSSFLQANSDPTSSKVYDSTRKMVDYVGSLNGVTDQTRLITVILSDMVDNEQDPEIWRESGNSMVESLTNYHTKGGGVALYFVSRTETGRWNQILAKAGFEPGEYVIETELSESPQLPRLD